MKHLSSFYRNKIWRLFWTIFESDRWAPAECLIFIHVFFWYCCYVDLSSPIHSLVSLGFNFELSGFSSIRQPSWYLFYSLWYVSTRCDLDRWYSSFPLLSLHRPLGTTVFFSSCALLLKVSLKMEVYLQNTEKGQS